VTDVEHPILSPLQAEHQAVVDILGHAWFPDHRWPVFDYLNRKLMSATGAAAAETLTTMPTVRPTVGHEHYRLIFAESGRGLTEPNDRIGLTVGGLFHLAGAEEAALTLARAIGWLADCDAALTPDPDLAVSLDMPVEELRTGLGLQRVWWNAKELSKALEQEPVLWGRVRIGHGGDLHVYGDRQLGAFRGVNTVEDYLQRVISYLGADKPPPMRPRARSPLDLAEAIGYLDAVWQLRFKHGLLGPTRPAAAAKLALPCSDADEFDARLSGLSDVLGQFTVSLPPDADQLAREAKEKSLGRLFRKLESALTPEALARAQDASEILRVAVRIRVGGQHSGLGGETARAFGRLGLTYPPLDWGTAWEDIQSRCATALDAIREELQQTE
jgi:hypothetical protein